ncbi:MAG: hypothetical protein IJ006_03540 [Lachnospiraceae bacterium]|nr:hypothetical protein [Lachnospiraceae bacterium]MBQ8846195.1 hypothetical protein [Lachnospiraceae bacterium]
MKPCDDYFEKEQSERKKVKPQAEEEINALLTNERQQKALDFVSYVKSLRMTPQWTSANSWAVSYKGKRVCYIKLVTRQGENAWYIRPAVRYDEELRRFCREKCLEEVMLANVHFCVGCGKCKPGTNVTFFDKELKHVCSSPIDFEFHNPNTEALECAKKLVEYRRAEIGCK